MVHRTGPLVGLARSSVAALAFCAVGCGSLDYEFDFAHESPTYVIESQASGAGMFESASDVAYALTGETIEFTGGWTGFRFDPEVGELPDELIGIAVKEVSLGVWAASSGEPMDADFVERLELYVLGTGSLPSFLLATYTRVEGAGVGAAPGLGSHRVALEVVETVNLKRYLEAGSEFYCFLQGVRPEERAAVKLDVEFHAFTRVSP